MKKLYFLAVLSALVLLYSGCVVENEEPPRPVELVISEQPTKVEYKKGDELDLSGLKVTLKKSDDTSEVLEKGKYTAVPSDGTVLAEPGKKTVTITAEGLSATFTITVTATKRLEISKQPTKVSYEKGDKLNLSGLEITLHKTDGTSELLTEYKTEPENGSPLTEPGEKTVRITAEGLSATFTITVTEPEEKPDVSAGELVISKKPAKVEYKKDEPLDLSGLEVTLKKPDGTSAVLTQYTTEPENRSPLTEPGETTVTVTAEGLSATFTITVTAPEEKPDVSAVELVISEQPAKVGYKKGDELDLSGLEVTLKKSDGTSEVLEEGEYTAVPKNGSKLTELGKQPVKIMVERAEGLEATFNICVAGLEILQLPKTDYTFYVPLDLSGLEVKRYNTDGTSEVLEQYATEPKDKSMLAEIGKQTVTITAGELTETFEISVSDEYIAVGDEKGELVLNKALNIYWGLPLEAYSCITENVKKITVADTVTKIGTRDEKGVRGLPVFNECSSLTSVVIPNSVTIIEPDAFRDCSNLTSVTIPNSVTEIGSFAFCLCSSLTSVAIPDSVTKIERGTFQVCSSLESIEIPSSVTEIGSEVFNQCSSLKSIEIPNGMTKIVGYAFYQCTGLESIEIPSSVTEIGNNAFQLCSSLTSIKIPDSVTKIEGHAFSGCSNLTSVTIPNSVTKIENYTFFGCTGLESIEIPDGVTKIGGAAFQRCSSLTSIKIPSDVTEIEGCAFQDCSSLKSIEIPNGVTKICYHAFQGCSSLESIEIPSSVTEIWYYAFQDCSSLTDVTIPKSVTKIENDAFSGCTNLKCVRYTGSLTEWKSFANLHLLGLGLSGQTVVCTDGEIQY